MAVMTALTDDFRFRDPTKWTWGAWATTIGGQLWLQSNDAYTGDLRSINAYDLTGSSLSIELVQRAASNGGLSDTYMGVFLNPSNVGDNQVLFNVRGTSLLAYRNVAGVRTTVATVTYDPVAHRWWRIREAGGTIFWDTSPNRATWTNLGSWVTTFAVTAVYAFVGTGTGAASTVLFDSLNIAAGSGRVADRWNGVSLTRQSLQRWSGSTLVGQTREPGGSGQRMPTGPVVSNGATFQPTWSQDFLTPCALGQFAATYPNLALYDGFEDTSRNLGRPVGQRGIYDSSKTATVSNSLLDMYVHTEGQVPYVCAVTPPMNQLYGRFSVRFKSDLVTGYKVAWLLWPDSDIWAEGELDFPEADLGMSIYGYSHEVTGTPNNNAFSVDTGASMGRWQTATIEWHPDRVVFDLDGFSWSTTATAGIPTHSMHWVLQTETQLSAAPPPTAAAGHVWIDWLAAWTRS